MCQVGLATTPVRHLQIDEQTPVQALSKLRPTGSVWG